MKPLSLFCLLALLFAPGCAKKNVKEPVVLYSSQDQLYAEPIIREFTTQSGIQVRSLFDSESAKTAGLAHRQRDSRTLVDQCTHPFKIPGCKLELFNRIQLILRHWFHPGAHSSLVDTIGR